MKRSTHNFKQWRLCCQGQLDADRWNSTTGNRVSRKAPIADCLFFVDQDIVWNWGHQHLSKDIYIRRKNLHTCGTRTFAKARTQYFGVHKTIILVHDWLLEPLLSGEEYKFSNEEVKQIIPFLVKPFIKSLL